MAGDNHRVLFDPSIDRWAAMRENVYQHFKFSRPITYRVVRWAVLFPAFIGAVSIAYNNKFDWAGKRREDSLLAKPPKQEEAAE